MRGLFEMAAWQRVLCVLPLLLVLWALTDWALQA